MSVNVMLVDSDEQRLQSLAALVHDNTHGGSLFTFTDSSSAVLCAMLNRIDVIFTGTLMENLDGFLLVSKIRRYNPDIHIVFVSDTSDFALEAVCYHPDRYLVAPVSGMVMNDIMNEYSDLIREGA